MHKFFAATDDEIAAGRTTDVYFERTMEVLSAKGKLDCHAVSEFTVGGLPDGWKWGVFCGSEELIRLYEGRPVDLYGLPEGTVFRPRTQEGIKVPVLRLEGPYGAYCELESPALGFICFGSGVATMSARCKLAAEGRTVMSFGVRRMHPAIAPAIDRASYIGGCDSVSSLIGAETIGQEASGTMPHALIIMMGDQKAAFKAFDEVVEKAVKRVALVDTFYDEKVEAVLACETIKDLHAVRLDTPASRRGSMIDIIREVRWEMDQRGYSNVKIFISGGLGEKDLGPLVRAGADGFGVGTSISNAPVIDFAMDIVEREKRPVSKRGKFSGRKRVHRCMACDTWSVSTGKDVPVCRTCGKEMALAEKLLLKNGKRTKAAESAQTIRKRAMQQFEKLGLE
ncbi:MAG: putative nicotinate phosphoribosyltransferase [Methanomassiliicoccales archaeon PtaU1.Bin124]|nr:MAG: putative nicotinate phosphoribosyltransferase [Methanomassiliicoccales archaeon PtaU1.Bin124]